MNYLQDRISLCIFYSGACRFDSKIFEEWNKISLELNPLSKITLRGLGYLERHTSLKIWDILAGNWSMIGSSAISNHPVAVSIKVMHNNWSSFMSILLSGCLTLDSKVHVPMRYTDTACHGIKVSSSLAGSNPYLALQFLNLWQSLQVLQSFCAWSTITYHLQMVVNFWASLSPPGCWRYQGYYFITYLRMVLGTYILSQ